MVKRRFSKDPKVNLVSIEEMYKETDYLYDINKRLWNELERPAAWHTYYKVTQQYIILIDYDMRLANYGTDTVEKLYCIDVAYRDGKTEYELLDLQMETLLEKKKNNKRKKSLDDDINQLKITIDFLHNIEFSANKEIMHDNFEDYIVDVGYKTQFYELKDKYVVFDVETNGIRTSNEDLLSITVYDPTSGRCYNRYLPLDLQPLVLTGWVHGITDEQLADATHITQDELNQLIDYFDLRNKTLLSFSGGKGTFDYKFIVNYCKRHNLEGLECLHYENIKSLFPNASFGMTGQMSKDNLCDVLKIEGVQDRHTGIGDCILEWKLFEKMKTEPIFFIEGAAYRYNEGYIVPISYLRKCPQLASYANIAIPNVVGKAEVVFEYSLPKRALKNVKKFPTNITGIAIENGINCALKVEKQDNLAFLVKHRSCLEYIGTLDSKIIQIPTVLQDDGSIMSLNPIYDKFIDEINNVTKVLVGYLDPIFEYIKHNIFTADNIMSQELSISPDGKVFACCDLSDKKSVLEIKTFGILQENNMISENLARQLYYESNGRNTYVLSVNFTRHLNSRKDFIIDSVNATIYRITLTCD